MHFLLIDASRGTTLIEKPDVVQVSLPPQWYGDSASSTINFEFQCRVPHRECRRVEDQFTSAK